MDNFIIQWSTQAFVSTFYEKLFKLKIRCFIYIKYLTEIINRLFETTLVVLVLI